MDLFSALSRQVLLHEREQALVILDSVLGKGQVATCSIHHPDLAAHARMLERLVEGFSL